MKAKKVLIALLNNILSLSNINSDNFFKMFDTKIAPIMLYLSELWGMFAMHAVENVQTYAFKIFLHTSLISCNVAILGNVGRFPMKIFAMKRCMKFWLRILKLRKERYVKLCYNTPVFFDNHGYVTWATYIRKQLYSNWFGYVWEAQNVDSEALFLSKYLLRKKINIYKHGLTYVITITN